MISSLVWELQTLTILTQPHDVSHVYGTCILLCILIPDTQLFVINLDGTWGQGY